MNYRKQKKKLTLLKKYYADKLESNPLNSTALYNYSQCFTKLRKLKRDKYENLGSYPNARADGSN